MRQSTTNIFLLRPARFNYNAQTAETNAFQNKVGLSTDTVRDKAQNEFDAFAQRLLSKGIDVMIVEDTPEPPKPDAVFPNNWGSFHADGTAILYPVAAPNRRVEKRAEILEQIKEKFFINRIVDLSMYEAQGKFLEGTGSVVFDHIHKIAYACLSLRTHQEVLEALCEVIGYKPMSFVATDSDGQEIYHTNVMMCVSEKFAVVCLESIKDLAQREALVASLEQTGHEIIDITLHQVIQFAGNMLSLLTPAGTELLVMSQSAYEVLTVEQLEAIENYCEPLPMRIDTIETVGGGSARCMISELFLEKR